MIIAIDGPAGSGKSTVAKAVACRLGLRYLDTGAMYRSVAVAALARGIALDDEDALAHIAEKEHISFEHTEGRSQPSRVFLGAEDVTAAIRAPEADVAVSAVSRLFKVREVMVAKQREYVRGQSIVAEGRDIGTVVFPDADIKVFLTASPEERARRRAAERSYDAGSGTDPDAAPARQAETLAALLCRDHADSTREVSPLTAADDAVVIDTTSMSTEEVAERVVGLVGEVGGAVAGDVGCGAMSGRPFDEGC
ncbi:MAG: (d)CMP kinase [Coriobacteriia bacterium]|nr:(d)CMP kinase [Coriobacteriia bacterium]